MTQEAIHGNNNKNTLFMFLSLLLKTRRPFWFKPATNGPLSFNSRRNCISDSSSPTGAAWCGGVVQDGIF